MNMKNLYGKLAFPFLFVISIFLVSCSDNNVPTTPNYPPNVFAEVSGSFEVKYKGQGRLFLLSNPEGIMMNSFFRDSMGTDYYMGVNIYFLDGILKTGKYPIVDKADTLQNYAVAFFETGKDNDKKTFISYSGEIDIKEITQNKIIADFEFLAKNAGGSTVMIKNGYMSINE